MKTLQEKIENQIEQYNDGDMSAVDCIKCLINKRADEIIEDNSNHIHYRIGGQEYEIVWHQDHHGQLSASVDIYNADEL